VDKVLLRQAADCIFSGAEAIVSEGCYSRSDGLIRAQTAILTIKLF
jgi:hypothetical protein